MLPLWVFLGITGILFAIGGTMFDKYLLERYFNKSDCGNKNDNSGPGALIIFSALFVVPVVLLVIICRYDTVDFSLHTGVIGMLTGATNGLWILLYLHAMSRADVSKVVPLFQTVPVFGLIFGMIILEEYLTMPQILSATVIMSGAIILMYRRSSGRLGLDVKTMSLMVGASCLVALSHVMFKFIAVDTNYWTATFWLGIGFALFGTLLFAVFGAYRRQFRSLLGKRRFRIVGLNGVNELFDNAGELIFLAAVVLGPVALVQSINAYEPMLIFLICLVLMRIWPAYFREDISIPALVQKFCGIAVISVGSIFLYTSI